MEQWLNEKLKKAGDQGIVGLFQKPEHFLPLNRYGLDRVALQGHGLSNQNIHALYRALTVHSFGIFETINDIIKMITIDYQQTKKKKKSSHLQIPSELNQVSAVTQGTTNGQTALGQIGKRQVIHCNIWRIFQILLEQACPSDYQMLTQTIEKQNCEKVEELRRHTDELESEAQVKDREATSQIKSLTAQVSQLTQQTLEATAERDRAVSDLLKVQSKLEEEVRLRLFFEEKLNTLYRVNMEEESLRMMLQEKLKKVEARSVELEKEAIDLRNENKELSCIKNLQLYKYKELEVEVKDKDNVIYQVNTQFKQTGSELAQTKNDYLKMQEDIALKTDQLATQSLLVTEKSNEITDLKGQLQIIQDKHIQSEVICKQQKDKLKEQQIKLEQNQQEIDDLFVKIVNFNSIQMKLKIEKETAQFQRQQNIDLIKEQSSQISDLKGKIQFYRKQKQEDQKIKEEMEAELRTVQLARGEIEFRLSHQLRQTDKLTQENNNLEEAILQMKKKEIFEIMKAKMTASEHRQQVFMHDTLNKKQDVELIKMRQQEVTMKNQFSMQEVSYHDLKQQLNYTQNELNVFKTNYEKLKIELGDKDIAIQNLQDQIENQKNEMQSKDNARKDLVTDMEVVKNYNDSLQTDIDSRDLKIQSLIEKNAANTEYFQDQLSKQKEQLATANLSNEDIMGKVYTSQLKLKKLTSQYEKLSSDHKYCTRRLLAHVIYRGMYLTRKQLIMSKLIENRSKIARQNDLIQQNSKLINELKLYKDTAEQELLRLEQKLKSRQEELIKSREELRSKNEHCDEVKVKLKKVEMQLAAILEREARRREGAVQVEGHDIPDLYHTKFTQTQDLEDKSIQLHYYERHKTFNFLRPKDPGTLSSDEWLAVLLKSCLSHRGNHTEEHLEEIDEQGRSKRTELLRKMQKLREFARATGKIKNNLKKSLGAKRPNVQKEIKKLMSKAKKSSYKLPKVPLKRRNTAFLKLNVEDLSQLAMEQNLYTEINDTDKGSGAPQNSSNDPHKKSQHHLAVDHSSHQDSLHTGNTSNRTFQQYLGPNKPQDQRIKSLVTRFSGINDPLVDISENPETSSANKNGKENDDDFNSMTESSSQPSLEKLEENMLISLTGEQFQLQNENQQGNPNSLVDISKLKDKIPDLNIRQDVLDKITENSFQNMKIGALLNKLSISQKRAFIWLFFNEQSEKYAENQKEKEQENGATSSITQPNLPLGQPKTHDEFIIFLRSLNKLQSLRKICRLQIIPDELAPFKITFALKDQEELKRQRELAGQFLMDLRLLTNKERQKMLNQLDKEIFMQPQLVKNDQKSIEKEKGMENDEKELGEKFATVSNHNQANHFQADTLQVDSICGFSTSLQDSTQQISKIAFQHSVGKKLSNPGGTLPDLQKPARSIKNEKKGRRFIGDLIRIQYQKEDKISSKSPKIRSILLKKSLNYQACLNKIKNQSNFIQSTHSLQSKTTATFPKPMGGHFKTRSITRGDCGTKLGEVFKNNETDHLNISQKSISIPSEAVFGSHVMPVNTRHSVNEIKSHLSNMNASLLEATHIEDPRAAAHPKTGEATNRRKVVFRGAPEELGAGLRSQPDGASDAPLASSESQVPVSVRERARASQSAMSCLLGSGGAPSSKGGQTNVVPGWVRNDARWESEVDYYFQENTIFHRNLFSAKSSSIKGTPRSSNNPSTHKNNTSYTHWKLNKKGPKRQNY